MFSLIHVYWIRNWVQFSSVTQSCPTLCNPMDCSTPGFPVHHQLLEPTQTHVHWVGDAVQPSYPLSSPSSPAFNLSQHQGLFQGVSSSHQVTKVLEFQLQHQSFRNTIVKSSLLSVIIIRIWIMVYIFVKTKTIIPLLIIFSCYLRKLLKWILHVGFEVGLKILTF